MSAPLIQAGADLLNKVVDPNAITTDVSNQATTKEAPAITAPVTNAAVQAEPKLQKNAAGGLTTAAQNTATETAPVAASINQSAQAQQNQGQTLQNEAQANYADATTLVGKKLTDAEDAMANANASATIDPQGFLDKMGVSKGTAVALGMLLSNAVSGAGAALTGQPNLAYQALQSSIQRDIEAQKSTFTNKIAIAAKQQGLLQNALDYQRISTASGQLANTMVNNGVANHAQGLQMQLGGQNAPALNNLNQLNLNQNVLKNVGDFGQSYINSVLSGDTKHTNMLGIGADYAKDQMGGTSPIGGVTNQVEPKFQKPTTTNPAMSTTKIEATPPAPAATPIEGSAPNETFLDALAKAGKDAIKRNLDNK